MEHSGLEYPEEEPALPYSSQFSSRNEELYRVMRNHRHLPCYESRPRDTTSVTPGLLCVFLALCTGLARAQTPTFDDLDKLTKGRTYAQNALWRENPPSAQFISSKTVVVADLKGPGVITMIHFALPAALRLNRDVRLQMY